MNHHEHEELHDVLKVSVPEPFRSLTSKHIQWPMAVVAFICRCVFFRNMKSTVKVVLIIHSHCTFAETVLHFLLSISGLQGGIFQEVPVSEIGCAIRASTLETKEPSMRLLWKTVMLLLCRVVGIKIAESCTWRVQGCCVSVTDLQVKTGMTCRGREPPVRELIVSNRREQKLQESAATLKKNPVWHE